MRNPEHSPALHGQLWLALQCSPYGVLFFSPGLVIGLCPFFFLLATLPRIPCSHWTWPFTPPSVCLGVSPGHASTLAWSSQLSHFTRPGITQNDVSKKKHFLKRASDQNTFIIYNCAKKERKKEKPCGFDFRTAPSPWKEAKRWGFKYNAGKYSSRTFYQRKKYNILRESLSESKNRSFIYFFHFLNKRNWPKSFTGKKVFEYKKKFISLWSVNVLWF